MLIGKRAGIWVYVWVCVSETEPFPAGYNQSRLVVNFAKAHSIFI